MKKGFYFILLLLAGLAFGYGLGSLADAADILPPKDELSPWFFAYIFLGLVLALVIHELGHLLTGLAYGFKFYYFTIFFLGIRREEDDSIKVYLNKDLNTFGGMAATLPTSYDQDTAKKFSHIILAGPLASLASILFSAIAFLYTSGDIRILLVMIGIMSLVIFLSVTIPSRTGLFYTDRKRYQRLRSEGIEKDIEIAYLKTTVHSLLHQPMKELAEEDLELLTQDASPVFRYTGYYFLYQYHLGDAEKISSLQLKMKELSQELPASMVKMMEQQLEKYASENE